MKAVKRINSLCLAIDRIINYQVNEIIHNDNFQKLESSWRGMNLLVNLTRIRTDEIIKIKVLDASLMDISNDINKSNEFYQTALFKYIYSNEYDQPGGEPFGLIIIDHEFKNEVSEGIDYIGIIRELSRIAETSFSSIIISITAEFLGIDTFDQLKSFHDLDNLFEQSQYKRWNKLRKRPGSKFINAIIPKILLRPPYQKSQFYYKNCFFEESINNKKDLLWGNTGYIFTSLILNSFIKSSWFTYINKYDDKISKYIQRYNLRATETYLHESSILNLDVSDHLEKQINRNGFMTLRSDKFSESIGCSCFISMHKIEKINHESNILHLPLQNILSISRFAHYIKVIMRDKIGSFSNVTECEDYLKKWLLQHTAAQQNSSTNSSIHYPLEKSEIKISSQISNPTRYICSLKLKPRLMIESIQTELKFNINAKFKSEIGRL